MAPRYLGVPGLAGTLIAKTCEAIYNKGYNGYVCHAINERAKAVVKKGLDNIEKVNLNLNQYQFIFLVRNRGGSEKYACIRYLNLSIPRKKSIIDVVFGFRQWGCFKIRNGLISQSITQIMNNVRK